MKQSGSQRPEGRRRVWRFRCPGHSGTDKAVISRLALQKFFSLFYLHCAAYNLAQIPQTLVFLSPSIKRDTALTAVKKREINGRLRKRWGFPLITPSTRSQSSSWNRDDSDGRSRVITRPCWRLTCFKVALRPNFVSSKQDYTVSQKKHVTILLSISSPNIDRF